MFLVLGLYSVLNFIFSNGYIFIKIYNYPYLVLFAMISVVLILIKPDIFFKKLKSKRLSFCMGGNVLLKAFLISSSMSFGFLIYQISIGIDKKTILINSIISILTHLGVAFNGFVRVFFTSTQIGIKNRIIILLFYMTPIVNLFFLIKLIKTVDKEVKFENKKIEINENRKQKKVCKTKYPILLVHGVFFRDYTVFNYWGRIPRELELNGAEIYYSNHSSALSVKESAKELVLRIEEILKKTGSDKVNIIAHSKGGLDSRYAISKLGMEKYVASLTMINTPNRGCEFADYLLSKVSSSFLEKVAKSYNFAAKKLGDKNPDFVSAVKDLTKSSCQQLNKELKNSSKVYYKSTGSSLKKFTDGKFPLNLTNLFVKNFDGLNDGLVGEDSFKYSDDYVFIETHGSRGISHGDVIDLNRLNIDGFDVREFYVSLVNNLKNKGF